jgi:hypothetical protein
MNNNKIQIALLGAILAVGLGVFIVSLQPEVKSDITVMPPEVNVEQPLGYGGYNKLGYSGVTHATTGISISVATGTTHTVLSNNSGRMWARVSNETASDYFTLQFTNSTSTATGTTPTFGTGNLTYGLGIVLAPGEEYVIGPDNLWQGTVVAIASSTATATISYMEK